MGRNNFTTSADDQNFLKFSGGGYAWGTTKKIQEGDVCREIKNIGGRYEF